MDQAEIQHKVQTLFSVFVGLSHEAEGKLYILVFHFVAVVMLLFKCFMIPVKKLLK